MTTQSTENAAENDDNGSKTLSICNWNRYQHYRTRRPPWVKFYVGFNEDTEHLPACARLLAALLFCVAANKENRIPNDPRWIAAEVAMPLRDVRNGLAALIADEFLRPSTPDDLTSRRTRRTNDPHASNTASNTASTEASETAREVTRARAVVERQRQRENLEAVQCSPLNTDPAPTATATASRKPLDKTTLDLSDACHRLLNALPHADDGTEGVLRSYHVADHQWDAIREEMIRVGGDVGLAVEIAKRVHGGGKLFDFTPELRDLSPPNGRAEPAPPPTRRPLADRLATWITNVGHADTEQGILHEFTDQERRTGETLTDTERIELLEHWRTTATTRPTPAPTTGPDIGQVDHARAALQTITGAAPPPPDAGRPDFGDDSGRAA